ncbi:hypothetical protein SVAN01_09543 [Stagonosporopsis vannaccii]|nr:hypothetical protein SVAN01_09543 [Stagonosporopsis vannaccii]
MVTTHAKPIETASTNESSPEGGSSGSCGNWDRSDPHQQEVSRILDDFKYDVLGIIHMSGDGIMRSLTADRKVLSAQGFTPEQIHAFQLRLPESYRLVSQEVDGTKTDRSTWFEPDKSTLPPPLSKERIEESLNMPEDRKEILRQRMKDKPK